MKRIVDNDLNYSSGRSMWYYAGRKEERL